MTLSLAEQKMLEEKLASWAASPSKSESERCDNAVRAVKKAIAGSSKLKDRKIEVIAQGSYRNRTNVRGDSDVDVGVICYDTFFEQYPSGKTREDFGNVPATYHYAQYKNEVQEALEAHFGKKQVTRGNKAFDIHENTYRVDADVAAFFEHRRYSSDGMFISGAELRPDNDPSCSVINWPEQHYKNGNTKNDNTKRAYRGLVRILKNVRLELVEAKSISGDCVTGFLCECLTWNTPNPLMTHNTWTEDLRETLVHLYGQTKADATCSEWGEVSELKYLFRSSEKWTRAQANDLIVKAWNHLKFS